MANITIEDLIAKVKTYNNNASDVELIYQAFYCADKMHKGQLRQSGEQYIIHPLAVAFILADAEADANTIAAGLLHDCVEDTIMTIEDIEREFGYFIAMLVAGVTSIKKINFSTKEEEIATNIRKLLNSAQEEVRVLLIKFADRLHNMRTLEYTNPDAQLAKALETMEIYVPLTYCLGLYKIKNELEDLSFKYINPSIYFDLDQKLNKLKMETGNNLKQMLLDIDFLLNDHCISHELKTQIKNIYGIYKRLQQGYQMDKIYDLISLKINVDNVMDCYTTLGLIHLKYRPHDGYFKDYIASPKLNMYQSLHTTVFGKGGILIQNQIRTYKMDKVSDLGLTAYWQDHNIIMNEELKRRFPFYRSLIGIEKATNDDIEYLKTIKKEVLGSNIYVYTPNDDTVDVIELPTGSTPVDLAYRLSTDTGDRMISAVVNGESVDPGYPLGNKDIVRIIMGDSIVNHSDEWLDKCKTTYARKKINEAKYQ